MAPSTDRQTFTETLQAEVATLQAQHPILTGALDKAFALVAHGAVFPLEDGHTAHVRSQSDPARSHLVNGTCDCKATQYHAAPCAHRLAFRVYQRTVERLTGDTEERWEPVEADAPTETTTPAPLPEAPASANCHITIAGRQVQLTLRDHDETRLLVRLQAVLAQYPVAQAPASQADATPQCPTHGALKRSTKGKGWFCPHKLADDSWCQHKGR